MRISLKSIGMTVKLLAIVALSAGLIMSPAMTGGVQAEVKKLKILSNNPFSGKAASWGFSQDRGVGLAVDKVNQAGGIKINDETYMWEKIQCDNRYIPADAVSCLKRGVAQGAKFMCTLGGAVTKPQIPLINKDKIVTIAAIAGGADFTNANNKYLFRTMPSADLTIAIEGIKIYKKLGVKKLVLLTADNVLGHSDAKTLKNALKVNKMSDILVAEEFVPIDTGDFTPVLTRVLAKNPDHIEGGAWPAAGLALLIKQARELGYKGTFTNLSGAPKVGPLVKIGGKKNVEGVIMLRLWPPDQLPTQAFKDYWAEYRKLYKQDPGANSWESYMAFMHLSAAVEKAQSLDPDKIVAVMRDLKIVSLLGELQLIGKDNPLLPGYGINNQYTSPLPVTVLKDGNPIIYK
ncbi:MAG: ABC transporter substrate-binding protein [Proteobacteria bacterium]|nr:ABC transporter substrate-binding protein [Pseudomonadota bacterium]